MKYLFLRFGGIGDTLVLTSVAKCIKKYQDPKAHITLAVREDIITVFENCRSFDEVIPIHRQPFDLIDCMRYQDLGWVTVEVAKGWYDLAIDFKNSIENNCNSPYDQEAHRKGDKFWWMRSPNSNFINWYDLSLQWANVDYTKVDDEDKRPLYFVKEDERREAQATLMGIKPIAIHVEGSSLCRRWYHGVELVKSLHDTGNSVLAWTGSAWDLILPEGTKTIQRPSLRQSAALIDQCEIVISADSGYGHIAEALNVPHITLYTTVPAWTREKYYKHSYPIETTEKCAPCFTLDRTCWRQKEYAVTTLSKRQREIFEEINKSPNVDSRKMELSSKFNTTPDGLSVEWAGIKAHLDGASQTEAPCLTAIKPQMIMDKVNEIRTRLR